MSLSITKQTNPQVPNLTYPPLPSWNIWPYPMPFTTRSWQWHQSFLPKKQMPSDGLKMYCMYLHCVLESGKQLRYKELRPVGSRLTASCSSLPLNSCWSNIGVGWKADGSVFVWQVDSSILISCIVQVGASSEFHTSLSGTALFYFSFGLGSLGFLSLKETV